MIANTHALCYNLVLKGVVVLMKKMCELYDRECIGCGECDRCDLDPNKICDNCMKCVNGDNEYRAITVDGIQLTEDEKDQ